MDTKRPYSNEDVQRLRGSLRIEHTLARRGNQAVQQVKAGLEAIYLSGWQVAADANLAGERTA
jgi:isocitrate lyase